LKLILQFLIGITLLMLLTLAQAQTDSPMGKFSTNPTTAEIYEEYKALVNIRPDLSQDELINKAIERAYEKKQGKRI